jgi:hypothetical protein
MDPALEAICLKAMALDPGQRYASPCRMADDIEHWLADEPTTAHRESWAHRLSRWSRRHRTWARAGWDRTPLELRDHFAVEAEALAWCRRMAEVLAGDRDDEGEAPIG